MARSAATGIRWEPPWDVAAARPNSSRAPGAVARPVVASGMWRAFVVVRFAGESGRPLGTRWRSAYHSRPGCGLGARAWAGREPEADSGAVDRHGESVEHRRGRDRVDLLGGHH